MKLVKCIALSFITLSVHYVAHAQPANDNCANATTLTVNASPLCGQTTASATTQAGETKPCGTTGAQTVWYKFVATATSMNVWVDNLVSGGCHLASGVWNTGTCLPATTLSCKGAVAPIDIWHNLTGLTIGNTYLISVVYDNGGPCNAAQTFCISVIAPPTTAGFTQPTTGMAGEFIGTCMTNTCSGQFYDNGGANGNYSNSINNIYRTFCPNAAGMCVRATVNYINIASGDQLSILNGPTQNSPTLATVTQVGNATTYTSTDASGCLGFRFFSDASTTAPGWNITLSCVPCAANTATDNNDCSEASLICSNATFTGASSGPGTTSDGCSGCNTSEHFTNWYQFCISTSGTLTFIIDPTVNTQDYDFALYGPGVTCGSLGSPIRCSYAANTGNTGLQSGAGDNSEDVTGNGFVNTLNVTAGQCYYLMVSQWSAGGSGFTINFAGSSASLDCIILPMEIEGFVCAENQKGIDVSWNVHSEYDMLRYELERSENGENFTFITSIDPTGEPGSTVEYHVQDELPLKGINYYRLAKISSSGLKEYQPLTGCFYNGENYFKTERLRLTDMSGRVVYESLLDNKSVPDLLRTLSIPNGTYILHRVNQQGNFLQEKYVRCGY